MKRNYRNSKLYVLRQTGTHEIFFVGGTTAALMFPYQFHERNIDCKKNQPLYRHIRKIGRRNFYIDLYKEVSCNSKQELNNLVDNAWERLQRKGFELFPYKIDDRLQKAREYTKKYRANHPELRETVECTCGLVRSKINLETHLKTRIHAKKLWQKDVAQFGLKA
jgi:hypothetical protein